VQQGRRLLVDEVQGLQPFEAHRQGRHEGEAAAGAPQADRGQGGVEEDDHKHITDEAPQGAVGEGEEQQAGGEADQGDGQGAEHGGSLPQPSGLVCPRSRRAKGAVRFDFF
jgi:hypothetical protein